MRQAVELSNRTRVAIKKVTISSISWNPSIVVKLAFNMVKI